MTSYETLTAKIDLCMDAARRTVGDFRTIWLAHAELLDMRRMALTVEEAGK